MTTHDYFSLPARLGAMILILSFVAVVTIFLSLQNVFSANTFKCLIALWVLVGLIGGDIIKNSYRLKRRLQARRDAAKLLKERSSRADFGG